MRKLCILLLAIAMVAGCAKQGTMEGPVTDKWNGYGKYLKAGEQVHTLWAGQHINIGTVTYGIDEDANFFVTYDCRASGWKMSETHMFAGDKRFMPLNKPGAPKVGLFPYSNNHNPRVSLWTYRVPLSQLPPCAAPGFVVAAHAAVRSPYGQSETAWAEGDFTFSDKGWGWYDDYYYNTPPNISVILYATVMTSDTLELYHIDVTHSVAELIWTESTGYSLCTMDGAAYDTESGMLFYANYTTGQLWVNHLQGEEPPFCAGMLNGIAASGTFSGGSYYYVNQAQNTLNKVEFTQQWNVTGETVMDSIPGTLTVNDIAMDPEGAVLYMLGQYNGGGAGLISWNTGSHLFSTLPIDLFDDGQIAFGSDGELYALAPSFGNDTTLSVILIDLDVLTALPLDEEVIVIDGGEFTDLAGGPAM